MLFETGKEITTTRIIVFIMFFFYLWYTINVIIKFECYNVLKIKLRFLKNEKIFISEKLQYLTQIMIEFYDYFRLLEYVPIFFVI